MDQVSTNFSYMCFSLSKCIFQNLKNKIDLACRTAEEFTKLYYDTIDKRRHVSRLLLSLNAFI